MLTNKPQFLAIDISMSFVWIVTGILSLFVVPEVGYEILKKAGINHSFANLCLYGGGITDLILGVWVLLPFQKRLCYRVQFAVVVIFTVLLTIIAPQFWLHPFGPATKNIPILTLIWLRMGSLT